MENKKKGHKKTTRQPSEIEEFLKKYKEWRTRYMAAKDTDSIPPDDDPPNPPGGDGDGE